MSIRCVSRDLAHAHPVSDLALWAAGLTFFGVLGMVPLVMEAVAVCGRVVGHNAVRDSVEQLLRALPNSHSIPAATRNLVDASLGLSWPNMAVLLIPTTVYGEGFRRSYLQMSRDDPVRSTGWRGRLAFLPIIVLASMVTFVLVGSIRVVSPLYADGGWALVAGVVTSFHITFVLLTVMLAAIYRFVGTVLVDWRPLMVASACTASIVAGFVHGFLVFLAIPIAWSEPFGGLPVVGTVSVLLLWLYGMHVVVIVGYRLALVLNQQAISGPTVPGRIPKGRPEGTAVMSRADLIGADVGAGGLVGDAFDCRFGQDLASTPVLPPLPSGAVSRSCLPLSERTVPGPTRPSSASTDPTIALANGAFGFSSLSTGILRRSPPDSSCVFR